MRRLVLLTLIASVFVCAAGMVCAQAVSNVEVHGFMLNRFYANPDASARFVTERISTILQAKVGDDGVAYFEVYWHPWITDAVLANGAFTAEWARTYVESAYCELPLGSGRIRVGKGRQLNFGMTPSYGNRKTTQYGIISETFTQDRIQGIQYTQKKGDWEGGLTLFSDQQVDTRSIGDYATLNPKVVRHIVDKDLPGRISGKLAVAAKFGYNTPSLQAHVSGCVGKLDKNRLSTITDAYGDDPETPNTDHNKFGFDAIYNRGPFVLQGEYYWGDFSYVGIDGYNLLVGYQPKNKMRLYARYAALDNDKPAQTSTGANVRQFTLGIVQPIRKGVWVEINYEKNMESWTPKVDNDLLFAELFTGF